jgi:hypothetical protein
MLHLINKKLLSNNRLTDGLFFSLMSLDITGRLIVRRNIWLPTHLSVFQALSAAQPTQCQIAVLSVNRIWKQEVQVWVKILSRNLPGGIEWNDKNPLYRTAAVTDIWNQDFLNMKVCCLLYKEEVYISLHLAFWYNYTTKTN